MKRENYNVEIIETSRELSARERVKFKDYSFAERLDDAIQTEGEEFGIVFVPNDLLVLKVHNEKSDNKDYEVYIVIDTEGKAYATGSSSWYETMSMIFDEMTSANEQWEVVTFKLPSKNRQGKYFLTCCVK